MYNDVFKKVAKMSELYQVYESFFENEIFEKKFNGMWRNIELVQEVLDKKQLERYHNCATYLKYIIVKDDKENLIEKLIAANFCKSRWCSVCNWRRSLKYRGILNKRIIKVKENYNAKFIFITLTIKNTYYKNLKKDLKLILKAFSKLFKYLLRKNRGILGYVRSLEFTIQKSDIEYINLHIHVLVAVTTSYFNKNYNLYLNQREWSRLWQKYLGVNYTPVVDVRVVKKRKKSDYSVEELVVFEVIKYVLKDTDILRLQKEKRLDIFKELYQSFKNVRNLGFGGVFAPKNFKQKEENEEDLINVKDSEIKGEVIAEIEYVLKDKDSGYVLKNLKEIKNEEKNTN
jgi:plasmid rolling circle replication initiator protein Rep